MAQDIAISIGLQGLSSYQAGLARAETATKKSGTRMGASFSKAGASLSSISSQVPGLGSAFLALANPITAVTAALVGVGTALVSFTKTAGKFEAQLSTVNALIPVTERVEANFASLRQEAARLGAETEFTATEAAQAMEFLGKAGFNTSQILAATADTLSLATVGGLNLAKASDIASDTLQQFGLNAGELGRVVDVIAATVTSSNTDVQQFSDAMNYLGVTANALGVPIEEASAAVGVLASGGLKGSLATRALGTSLTRLAQPTKKMRAVIGELGLSFFDTEGNFIGLNATIGQLEDKFTGLTQQQKQAALTSLFGAEAIQEYNLLLEKGSKGLEEYTAELKAAGDQQGGFAQGIRDLKLDNFEGSIKILSSAWESFAIAIGSKGLPGLKEFNFFLADVIRNFSGIVEGTKSFGDAFGPIGGAIDKITAAYGRFIDSVGDALAEIFGSTAAGASALADVFTGVLYTAIDIVVGAFTASIDIINVFIGVAAGVINFVRSIANSLIDAGSAVGGFIADFAELIGISEKFSQLSAFISSIASRISGFFDSAALSTLTLREALGVLQGAITGTLAFISTVVSNFVAGFTKSFEGLGDLLSGIFTGNTNLIQAGWDKLLIGLSSSTVDIFSGASTAYNKAFQKALPDVSTAIEETATGADLTEAGEISGQTFINGILSQIGQITNSEEGKRLSLSLKNQVKNAYADALISTDQYRSALEAIDAATKKVFASTSNAVSSVDTFSESLKALNGITKEVADSMPAVDIPVSITMPETEQLALQVPEFEIRATELEGLGTAAQLFSAARSEAYGFAESLGFVNVEALEFAVVWEEAVSAAQDVALDAIVNSVSVLGEELANVIKGTQTFSGAMLAAFQTLLQGLLVDVPKLLGMVLLKQALYSGPAGLPMALAGIALIGFSGIASGLLQGLSSDNNRSQGFVPDISRSQARSSLSQVSPLAQPTINRGQIQPQGLGGLQVTSPEVNVSVFVGNERLTGIITRNIANDQALRG